MKHVTTEESMENGNREYGDLKGNGIPVSAKPYDTHKGETIYMAIVGGKQQYYIKKFPNAVFKSPQDAVDAIRSGNIRL